MRIKKSHLKQIINEEIAAVVAERKFKQDTPSNPYHTGKDGRFTDYEGSKSWSLNDKKRRMKSGKNAAPCGRGERRRCKDGSLKWEGAEEPRSDSTSRFRRDDPRYENETQRRERTHPGYEQMQSLSRGIAEAFDESMSQLSEDGSDTICYNHQQLARLRQSVFQQTLAIISQYEDAKKLSPHLKQSKRKA